MKTALAVLGQLFLFALFLGIFLTGSFLGVSHNVPHWFVSNPTPTSTRFFVPSGLILATVLFLIVVGIEAVAKRLRTAGKWTTVAFLVAVIIGLLSKFGWVTT